MRHDHSRQGAHTASELRRSTRRLIGLAGVDQILGAMRKGEALHLQYENGRPPWSLSGGRSVAADVATRVIVNAPRHPGRRRLVCQRTGPDVEVWMMTDKPDLKLIEAAASDDPFDLARLRISPEMLETTSVKKLLTTVPVRKPIAQDFIEFREPSTGKRSP